MNRLIVNPFHKKSKIQKEIYGHFAEHLGRGIYEGIYVGEDAGIPNENGIRTDVLEALRAMKIPVLRWPGGCFADNYHWRDAIGAKDKRKKMINTNWGGIVEDNRFGTHEFMNLCEALGCEAYITGNVGSGTVQEMQEWLEYLTSQGNSPITDMRRENGRQTPWKVKYWGIGNESWGCGGHMVPAQYGYEYRKYSAYCRSSQHENPLYRIACGANEDDYAWTKELMEVLSVAAPFGAKLVEGISLHYYTTTDTLAKKGPATDFTQEQYYAVLNRTLHMDTLIRRHSDILNQYDPKKEIGLIVDEWGTWFDTAPGDNPAFLYQQNTMRDALVAAINFNIFHKHADRVKMANIAQMVNVLQAVILTEGDKMVLTPTYHVFKMFSAHQENTLLDSFVEAQTIGSEPVPNLHESASLSADGSIHLSLCNLSYDEPYQIRTVLVDTKVENVKAEILTQKPQAHNTFCQPESVRPEPFTDFSIQGDEIQFTIPACSILQFQLNG